MSLFDRKKKYLIEKPVPTEEDHIIIHLKSKTEEMNVDLYDVLSLEDDKINVSLANWLSLLFYRGENGIKKDFKREFYFSKLAADLGDAHNQYLVALLYLDGVSGVIKKDVRTAYKYMSLSAKQGKKEAQFKLACILFENSYLEKNWGDMMLEAACRSHMQGYHDGTRFLQFLIDANFPGGKACIDAMIYDLENGYKPGSTYYYVPNKKVKCASIANGEGNSSLFSFFNSTDNSTEKKTEYALCSPSCYYDNSGVQVGARDMYYDGSGVQRSSNDNMFYDGNGVLRKRGDMFYDAAGILRKPGEAFYCKKH